MPVHNAKETRLAAVVAISSAVAMAMFVGLHWNQQVAGAWTESEVAKPPSSLISLLSVSAPSLFGDVVYLNDVRLKTEPKSGVFIIEGAQGRRMLVLFNSVKDAAVSGTVDIKGQILQLPDQRTLRKEWHLTGRQADVFEKEDLYIDAEYIKNHSQ
jgi:hypothetical protein